MERDPRVTGIFENWDIKAPGLSKEVLDKIGELWITRILGCDENTLESFKTDDVNDEIGLKHAGVTDYVADSRGFWTEINKITPELAPDTELEYLIGNDDGGIAAWAMLCALDENASTTNSLITKLTINARLYR